MRIAAAVGLRTRGTPACAVAKHDPGTGRGRLGIDGMGVSQMGDRSARHIMVWEPGLARPAGHMITMPYQGLELEVATNWCSGASQCGDAALANPTGACVMSGVRRAGTGEQVPRERLCG